MNLGEQYVARPFPELVHHRVAEEARKRGEVLHHPVSSEDAHGLLEGPGRVLGRHDLLEHHQLPRLEGASPIAARQPVSTVHLEGPGGGPLHRSSEVLELGPDHRETFDGAPEGLPERRVRAGLADGPRGIGCRGEADGQPGDREDDAHRVGEPPLDRPERPGQSAVEGHLGGGQLAGSRLPLEPVHGEAVPDGSLAPRGPQGHCEQAEGARGRLPGGDGRVVGVGHRAEELGAGDPVAIAVPDRLDPVGRHVGSPLDLGEELGAHGVAPVAPLLQVLPHGDGLGAIGQLVERRHQPFRAHDRAGGAGLAVLVDDELLHRASEEVGAGGEEPLREYLALEVERPGGPFHLVHPVVVGVPVLQARPGLEDGDGVGELAPPR